MKEKISKIIRVITVPVFVSFVLLLILWLVNPAFFQSTVHFVLAVIFICLLPMLAYPISYFIPKLKVKGREFQRKLAIALSLVGYFAGFAISLLTNSPAMELVVYSTYFFSGLLLIVCDTFFGIKASGHSCSLTGPIAVLTYAISPFYLFGLLLLGLVYASSIILKRHTIWQLLIGSALSVIAFIISAIIFL